MEYRGNPTDPKEFIASLSFDRRLYKYDIRGSLAHVAMLAKCGIIPKEDAGKITRGLKEIEREIEAGKFRFDIADEDIHMSIERALIEKVGPLGGKLHTARSRNDQIALDIRMYLKEEILKIGNLIRTLQKALLNLAKENTEVIMPGYTHLQRAQPVLFSHHIMAYFFMLGRDIDRLKSCYERTDAMPLGSAALAGTSFPIDREFVAKELGFSKIAENSMDAVSDRDFLVEFLSSLSLLMIHLSSFCEELVLWSTSEFGFIQLDEAFTTGSSIMPQKRNPDVAELIRGKTGRTFGHLMGLLTTLKALPLTYNRDLQEDKEPLFDAVDTAKRSLEIFTPMVASIRINPERMGRAAEESFTVATDVADYLVRKGLPFREAHGVVGKIIAYCLDRNCVLSDLNLEDYRSFSPLFDQDVFEVLEVKHSVDSKTSVGGTSVKGLKDQFIRAESLLESEKMWLSHPLA
ncbi:MAG: argininosuccinate lyase [Actinomycetota bacterium]|nr:argininosuccinate lyase [Actinomycetota bacterium]